MGKDSTDWLQQSEVKNIRNKEETVRRADNDCMIKKITTVETVQFQENILIVELLQERQWKLYPLGAFRKQKWSKSNNID